MTSAIPTLWWHLIFYENSAEWVYIHRMSLVQDWWDGILVHYLENLNGTKYQDWRTLFRILNSFISLFRILNSFIFINLIFRSVHEMKRRFDCRFMAIDCQRLPYQIESAVKIHTTAFIYRIPILLQMISEQESLPQKLGLYSIFTFYYSGRSWVLSLWEARIPGRLQSGRFREKTSSSVINYHMSYRYCTEDPWVESINYLHFSSRYVPISQDLGYYVCMMSLDICIVYSGIQDIVCPCFMEEDVKMAREILNTRWLVLCMFLGGLTLG